MNIRSDLRAQSIVNCCYRTRRGGFFSHYTRTHTHTTTSDNHARRFPMELKSVDIERRSVDLNAARSQVTFTHVTGHCKIPLCSRTLSATIELLPIFFPSICNYNEHTFSLSIVVVDAISAVSILIHCISVFCIKMQFASELGGNSYTH